MNLKNIKRKLKLLRFIFSHNDLHSISNEDRLKGIILTELESTLKITNIEQSFQIHTAIDSIVSKFNQKSSLTENFKTTVDGVFHHQMWFFSAVSGYAALWELQVKFLAEHLGIETKEHPSKRSKHHKKNRIMTNRDLRFIISDIEKKISRNFDLRLTNLNGLRSSLVHGNFDQLRILANSCKHNYKKEHQGNVFVFSFDKPEAGANLSKNLPQQTKEQQSLFSWFIEITNTQLLREVWHLFDKSVMQINCLINFGSYSFDDRKEIFEKVVLNGEKITPEMMNKYADVIKISSPMNTVDSYFGHMKKIFGEKIFTTTP